MLMFRELIDLIECPRTWNFFKGMTYLTLGTWWPYGLIKHNFFFSVWSHPGKGQLTTEEFPPDLDTTSFGLTVLKYDKDTVHSVMDEMLGYVSADGIIQVSIQYYTVILT